MAQIERGIAPLVVNHQGQFPSVTDHLQSGARHTLDRRRDARDRPGGRRDAHCPTSIRAEFAGDARPSGRPVGAQPLLILAALIAVYIVLGVLYESLAHPLTIISTLPSAGLGALLALQIVWHRADVIAFIGIILLIGIVKKNGIMMVDFALDGRAAARACRRSGRSTRPACERFRPILMTTLAAMLGAVPLVIAIGPGLGAAAARSASPSSAACWCRRCSRSTRRR